MNVTTRAREIQLAAPLIEIRLAVLERRKRASKGSALAPGLDYAPMYFIAVCSRSALPSQIPALSLFGDREESVYAHYNHEIRKNMGAGVRIAELEAEVGRLRSTLDARSPPVSDRRWWRRKRPTE